MSQTPGESAPTLEERVTQLEHDLASTQEELAEAQRGLEAADTVNAVLQERYGPLLGQVTELREQVAALASRVEALPTEGD